MGTKKCSKCHEIKEVCEFTKDKNKIDGLFVYCKLCKRLSAKKEYEKNKERILTYQKEYYLENSDKIKLRTSNYGLKNKEKIKEKVKLYYQKNIEQRLYYAKQYRENNKEKRNSYETHRKKTDTVYRLKHLVRNRIIKFLTIKRLNKKHPTFELVGCSPEELKIYLEKKFTEGMSWDNQGKWHIDHKIPLSSAKTEEELYNLCHFTNLQPMWATENIKKGFKII